MFHPAHQRLFAELGADLRPEALGVGDARRHYDQHQGASACPCGKLAVVGRHLRQQLGLQPGWHSGFLRERAPAERQHAHQEQLGEPLSAGHAVGHGLRALPVPANPENW
jgi:hypothetical protein